MSSYSITSVSREPRAEPLNPHVCTFNVLRFRCPDRASHVRSLRGLQAHGLLTESILSRPGRLVLRSGRLSGGSGPRGNLRGA